MSTEAAESSDVRESDGSGRAEARTTEGRRAKGLERTARRAEGAARPKNDIKKNSLLY